MKSPLLLRHEGFARFRPLSGIQFSLRGRRSRRCSGGTGFRPLSGIQFSLPSDTSDASRAHRFRPLSGIQFSLQNFVISDNESAKVSVPSRGFNSHYSMRTRSSTGWPTVSVPSRGFNSHYPTRGTGQAPAGFRPLSGIQFSLPALSVCRR